MKSLKEVYGYSNLRRLDVQKLREIITEEVDKLSEEASPSKVDPSRFPLKLSQVDAKFAKQAVIAGTADGDPNDDVIGVGEKSYKAGDLKPSQTSMNVGKAVLFALSMLNKTMPGSGGPGGDLGAFISSDNYIMDGHHRWIATTMVDPSASITGIDVAFPGTKLVAVLNAMTKGKFGRMAGKAGTGGFDQFSDVTAVADAINKVSAPIGGSAADKDKVLAEFTDEGTAEAAAEKMVVNIKSAVGNPAASVMPGAPPRPDMPVIDNDESPGSVQITIDALQGGEIDVNEPYGSDKPAAEDDDEKKEEVFIASGDLILARWNKLAGLLND